jgi:hypothetical protein
MMMPVGAPGFGGGFGSSSIPTFHYMYINPTYDNFNSYKTESRIY